MHHVNPSVEYLEMDQLEKKVIYTGKTRTVGGRDGGSSASSDGRLDIKFSVPGTPGTGTNPEQLLAAGWSACFIGAMGVEARRRRISLPSDTAVDAEVDLCQSSDGYSLKARLNISLPGLEPDVAQGLAEAGHQTCPYSKALKDSTEVVIRVV
jgi:Ohr subfamily peroxiredoxin